MDLQITIIGKNKEVIADVYVNDDWEAEVIEMSGYTVLINKSSSEDEPLQVMVDGLYRPKLFINEK